MKLLIAIIKPFKLEEVRDALTAIGINGMTVTEVKGYGRQQGHKEIYRGAEYTVNFVPKLKIEVGIPPDLLAKAIDVVTLAARTGEIGDGKIFVTDVAQAVRIRTGERDIDALRDREMSFTFLRVGAVNDVKVAERRRGGTVSRPLGRGLHRRRRLCADRDRSGADRRARGRGDVHRFTGHNGQQG
jgi:nitrogen regulatory protein P-II 2